MQKAAISCFVFFFFLSLSTLAALAEETAAPAPARTSEKLTLTQALICESIGDGNPRNQAVVFSIAIGKIFCFTAFDPVPEETSIYHNWYYHDTMSTTRKLYLRTPAWRTYSSIQLREADKGPWRVEITDHRGLILQTLRFSITD